MAKQLLSLCATPVALLRDGYTGANAKLLIPFVGWWYASGQTLSFPSSRLPQATGSKLAGTKMINNYSKDCCDCSSCGGPTEYYTPTPRTN